MIKVGIIGGGASALFSAYQLSKYKEFDITIFEKGRKLENRHCPLIDGKANKCCNCETCSITSGIAGAGAFSDGKYIMSTEYGRWLQDIVNKDSLVNYMKMADDFLVSFGATTKFFEPDNELKKDFLKHDLYMLQARCKHLGTDLNYITMMKIIKSLENKANIHIITCATVENVESSLVNSQKKIVTTSSGSYITVHDNFDVIIFAVGRSGNNFFKSWCDNNGIKTINNQVDIGVRVELPALVWKDFTDKVYEPKLVYKTKQYGDKVRTFCCNFAGEVVAENNGGIISVNGHSYANPDKFTENTNFALLSTINFTEPFNEPVEYARRIVSLANAISGGGIIVQTLGDLENGRRTNASRLKNNMVTPTLKSAVAGDLSLCLPKRQLDNIIETLHAIDKAIPGTANPDTLLYGVEAKYYSARPQTTNEFEMFVGDVGNYYAMGDGAGFTRSLSQACAQGLMIADILVNKFAEGQQ